MTTAIIGTGGIGSAIARQLASGGETLRSPRPATATRCGASVPSSWRCGLPLLKGVIDQIAGPLAGKLVVVQSNPVSTDAHGNLSRVLPEGAILWEGPRRAAAGRGAAGHGVRNPAGRPVGVRCQPVTGAGGRVLRDRR